ncbi:MAG: response regulator [Anaerolineae bacterium]|nr:response regulator [Anaerolineae bacterium]
MQPTPTILVVDDQSSAREVLSGLLAGQNYHLAFAGNGEEALTKAVALTPDLILLDVMMPGMDGFEGCVWLRADPHLAEIPIIMVTSLDDRDSRLRGLAVGIDDFISKLFDGLELGARIKTITRLDRYRRLLLERAYRQQAEQEIYRRNRELTLLNQVIMAAASTLNVQDILHLACEALAQAFELPQATALLLNEARTEFVAIVEYLAPAIGLGQARLGQEKLTPQGNSSNGTIPLVGLWSEYLLEYKIPLVITGTEANPPLAQVYEVMRQRGLASLLIVPIVIDHETVGLIELGATERRHLSAQALTLTQSIATAIGQALETARLYQNLQHYVASLEDTVAKRTRELQNERDRIRAILEALGEAVVVTDTAGAIQYLNPATVALTGFTEAEALGQNWRLWQSRKTREWDDGATGEPLYAEIAEQVGAGQTWRGEVNNQRKDGSLYDALLTVAPLFDPNRPNQPIGFVSVQNNITPLKEAERLRAVVQGREKQAALDRLRQTFLSTVNHELRTPLALIFQIIEMFENGHLGKLRLVQRNALMALRRQIKILGQMVEGLTRLAAFLSKQETVRPVLARLEPVFQNVIPLAKFMARSKEIILETDITPDLPPLPLDVKQIDEALTQLLDNAVKFNRAGGKIMLSAQADDKWVTITISDTGVGIETEQLDRIWELFEQGTDPLRRAQEGLGLGLVLARYIVEADRGTIEVESTLGQGSTFTVKLPRLKSVN